MLSFPSLPNCVVTGVAALLKRVSKTSVTVAVDGSLYKYHPKFHNLMTEMAQQLLPHQKVCKEIIYRVQLFKTAADEFVINLHLTIIIYCLVMVDFCPVYTETIALCFRQTNYMQNLLSRFILWWSTITTFVLL